MKKRGLLPPTYFLIFLLLAIALHFVLPLVKLIYSPRFTRHPTYLGMVVILVGVAILLGSISPFICPFGFFIAMSIVFVPQEEKALKKTFGQDFINYKRRVRCWV